MSRELSAGQQGEERAVKFLLSQGLAILARNYRSYRGELDIVARDVDTLCFVEVRLRDSGRYGSPLETIGLRKRKNLSIAAMDFLIRRHLAYTKIACRFDVIGIERKKDEIVWLKNAFEITTRI